MSRSARRPSARSRAKAGEVDIVRRARRAARRARRPDRRSRSASSCASRSGVRRLRAGRAQIEEACRRRWCAAPVVSRSTKRSPTAAAIGCSSTSCTSASRARRDRLVAEQHDARADLGRGVMQPHRHPLRDRLGLGRRAARSVASMRSVGACSVGIEHDVAARDRVLGDAVAGEIERAALAGLAAFGRPVLRVDRAHARRQARTG